MTQSKQMTPVQEIRHTLDRMEGQFKAALPAHISPEKFIRVAATAVQTNPELQGADRNSLYAACTKAAQDGLLPDGRESALVMFGKQATYMPMIAGILKKLRNSGELSSITSQVIHRNDPFKYWIDSDGEHLEFRPNMLSDRGEIVGAFAMAKLTDGALYVEVMTKDQIEQVRSVSRAGKNGPWVTWWDEMARKSVMRRLAKRLPMSTDIDAMFGIDDERVVEAEVVPLRTEPAVMQDVTPEPDPEAEEKPKRQSRARAAVEAKKEQEPQPEEPPMHESEPEGEVIDMESDEDPGDEVPI